MLKNKDGTYNKFNILIVSLISLISIVMIGSFILSNVEIPRIEIPQQTLFKDTPTPVVTSSITPPNLFSNSTYENTSNNKSWLGETYEVGRTGGGGGAGGYAYPRNVTNATFIVIAGGGGGAGSYAYVGGGGNGGSGYIIYNYTVDYNSTNYTTYFNSTESNTPTSWNWSFTDNNFSTSQEPLVSINLTSSEEQNFTTLLSSTLKIDNLFIPLILIVPVFIGLSLFIRNRSSMLITALIAMFLYYLNIIPFMIFSLLMVGSTGVLFMEFFNWENRETYR